MRVANEVVTLLVALGLDSPAAALVKDEALADGVVTLKAKTQGGRP